MLPISIKDAQLATAQLNIYGISIMQKYAIGHHRVCVYTYTGTEE